MRLTLPQTKLSYFLKRGKDTPVALFDYTKSPNNDVHYSRCDNILLNFLQIKFVVDKKIIGRTYSCNNLIKCLPKDQTAHMV